MADPNQLPKPPQAPAAPQPQQPKPQLQQAFQRQRDTALRAANQGAQQNQDAVQRRLAAMGQLNSGTGIQAQQEQQAAAEQQRQAATAGIDAQEAQMAGQRDMFDQTFGLDKTMKEAQLDLARKEFDRDTDTTNFNQAVVSREQGFAIDLLPFMDKNALAKHYDRYGDTKAGDIVRAGDWAGFAAKERRLAQAQEDQREAIRRAVDKWESGKFWTQG